MCNRAYQSKQSYKNLQQPFLTLTRGLNLNCHLTSLFPVIGKQQVQLGKRGRFTTTYMQCHLCVRGKLSVSPNSWLAGSAHSVSTKDPGPYLLYLLHILLSFLKYCIIKVSKSRKSHFNFGGKFEFRSQLSYCSCTQFSQKPNKNHYPEHLLFRKYSGQ